MTYNSYNYFNFPSWISNRSIVIYLLALVVVTSMYFSYSMPWYFMFSGIISVFIFFYFSKKLIRSWSEIRIYKEKSFVNRLFIVSFVLRLSWTLLIYFVFMISYGDVWGFEAGDPTFYDTIALTFSDAFKQGDFINCWKEQLQFIKMSDLGYAYYMGIIYALSNNSQLVLRIIKCILSAYTVVLVYRMAKRNFGEDVGRLSAIFCMLWPNFWYYCGTGLKETEMVFLTILFVEQTDVMLKSRQFTIWKIIPLVLIIFALFTIRTPLALIAVLSLLFSVVMSSSRVVGWGKRIIVGVIAAGLVAVTMGNRINEEAQDLLNQAKSDQQAQNMEWRTRRANGNKFAKYAGKTVFAPLIFTIPFPSMVRPYDGQDTQQLLNGGNYIKNILSFFTIFVMVLLLVSGKWRLHLVPLSFFLGYLVVLALSTFAQSERFHQPIMPFELMFAAYGIQQALIGVPIAKGMGTRSKYKHWFGIWTFVMFIAALVWNWFKIAGRGLA